MIGSFQTGVSGLQQFQQDLEVIGNNIANVETIGFKSSRMDFEDTFSQNLNNGSATTMQVGTGVATGAIKSSFTQGTINLTGLSTDLAIAGKGFFVVRNAASGASFVSRDGEFNLDANGYLVNNDGLRVQGYIGAAPITSGSTIGDIQINTAAAIASLNDTRVPAPTLTAFTIDTAGQVNVRLSNGVSVDVTGVMAQVVLQDFTNPQALLKQGNNLYTYGAAAGPLAAPVAPNALALGSEIRSGALEESNVDLGEQMVELITAQRAFQANAKIVTTSDEILQDLVNLKR